MSYFHDRYGLEADGVLHLEDGRYALLEFKLGGGREVDEGAEYLLEIEKLIREHNEKGSAKLRLPDLKMAITGTQYGFLRSDVIYVVPVGCLRD